MSASASARTVSGLCQAFGGRLRCCGTAVLSAERDQLGPKGQVPGAESEEQGFLPGPLRVTGG